MVISLVGTPTTSTSTSMSVPSGLAEKDLVIVASYANNTSQNLPTGFTNGQDGNVMSITYYRWSYRLMGSTPISSVSGLSSSSAHVCFALRGVDSSTPLDVSVPNITDFFMGMPNPPAITTATAGAWIVAVGFLRADNITPTAQSGYTLIGYQSNTGTVMVSYKVKSTAGSDDPAAFGGSGFDIWAAATFALRPLIDFKLYSMLWHPF